MLEVKKYVIVWFRMRENVVAKFGGTSMAHPEVVASIIDTSPERQIIVASAPGRLEAGGPKVTDLLIDYAATADNTVRDDILDRFKSVFEGLSPSIAASLIDELKRDLDDESKSDEEIVSRGEYFSAKALAARLGIQFVDASELFRFSGSAFDRQTTEHLISQRLGNLSVGQKIAVPGFYGKDQNGQVRLFERGGSDRHGAILSSTSGLTYENWTDVDGIFSADPRIVPSARVIDVLTRDEVREGAHGGAEVLQGDTIIDLNGSSVDVVIRNTFNPSAPGTKVVKSRDVLPYESAVAFSGRDDLSEITVNDMGMANTPGYVAHLLDYFGDLGLSVQHMPQAQDAFSITALAKTDAEQAAVQEFIKYAQHNLRTKTASVEVSAKGVVYAVGEALKDPRRRTAAQVHMLGEVLVRGYSVEDVVSHRNSPSLAFLVCPEDVNPVLTAMHERQLGDLPL